MKFLCLRWLCALSVLCGSALPSYSLDRHAFTFTDYDLNIRIEPEQQRLGVRGKLTLRNDSDQPQSQLVLQVSSSLHWVSLQFQNKGVEFVSQPYTSDIDHTGALSEAIVVLPRAIASKQTLELEIAYEGTIPQDATRETRIGVPADVAKHSDWDQISKNFTAVRGIGYVAWYPIATEAVSLSEGNSVFEEAGRWKQREAQSTMKLNVCQTAPAPSVLMNDAVRGVRGATLSADTSGNAIQCREHDYLTLDDIVPVFVVHDFSETENPSTSVYYLPQHKSAADDYALAVDQVTPFISKWFGDHRDTHDTKIEVIDLPDPNDAPFESGNMLLLPLTSDETTMLLSALRQTAHLYFPSPRPWISEGLAAYAQANYFLNERGREAALAYLQAHRSALVQTEKENLPRTGNRSAATSLINAPDEFYVQSKAMNVWWMLRDIAGDVALTAALHKYKAGDDIRADYMQKLIEAESHRDLEWFFDDWVYRDRGLPNFSISSVYPRALLTGGYMTTVEVENKGAAGAQISVTAHMATGDTTEKLIVGGNSNASVRIATPALPGKITVNDGSVPESQTTTHVYNIEASR